MWLYNDVPIDSIDLSEYVGFVYVITNKVDDRIYIGKKLLKFKRTKTIKGKKKKIFIDSDWKDYWGSSKLLHLDLDELGKDSFKREVLRLCKSRGELNYYEAKYQFDWRVLESDKFYNEWISLKSHKVHLKNVDFSDRKNIMILANTNRDK